MTKHRYFCPYEIGVAYASLGDQDTAYELFRKGTGEHADCMALAGRRALARSVPLRSALRRPPARHRARSGTR